VFLRFSKYVRFAVRHFHQSAFLHFFSAKSKKSGKIAKNHRKTAKIPKKRKNPGKRNRKAGKIQQIAGKRRDFDKSSLQNRVIIVFASVNLKRSVDVKIEKSESAVSQTKNTLIQERMKKRKRKWRKNRREKSAKKRKSKTCEEDMPSLARMIYGAKRQ